MLAVVEGLFFEVEVLGFGAQGFGARGGWRWMQRSRI